MESTMKPPFPEVAPVIEIFPGVHATLTADWSRYSNGTFAIGGCEMTAGGKDGKPVGTIGCDGGGRWVFTIGEASYEVNMREAFEAVMSAHLASLRICPICHLPSGFHTGPEHEALAASLTPEQVAAL